MKSRLRRSVRAAQVRDLGRDPAMWLAFGAGTGLSPVAPGTFGALLALPLAWALRMAGPAAYAGVAGVVIVGGVWLCGHAARRLGVHDHPGINLDEVAGQLLACAGLPATWPWFAAAFVLFRVLDVAKPWPISWLDRRLGGGLGIMADDIVAGAVAGVVLWALDLARIFHGSG